MDIKRHDDSNSISLARKKLNPFVPKRLSLLVFSLVVVLLSGFGCAATKEEVQSHEGAPSMMTHGGMTMMMPRANDKDYVYPLAEINLNNVIEENQGLKMLRENATMVHDYYRGGVQEKAEGERLTKEKKWKEAEAHFEKSNRYLQVVVRYLPTDEPCKNIYSDQVVIFLPNLLMADNQLKLMEIYSNTKRNGDIYWARREGKGFLSRSLDRAKTEWGYRLKKDFEEKFKKEEMSKN
jgi:hypothetical protein